jgi:NTE family protein
MTTTAPAMNLPPPTDDARHTGTALLLPGGGARAAYQVGVLKGIAELSGQSERSPLPILCGTSAGAINAVAMASRAGDFSEAVIWLEQLWLELGEQRVYRADVAGVLHNAVRLVMSLFNAGIAVGKPVALLNNSPLRDLLGEVIDFDAIGRHINDGALEAVCVTAMNYTLGTSESFFQGGPGNAGWQRWRRQGIASPITLRHLMASAAIPTIFPPVRIAQYYYGDGALRQLNPISPALHLGARRILIIPASGHRRNYERPIRKIQSPAFGQVIGHLLNSAFIDNLETDIEMLERINEMVSMLTPQQHADLARPLAPVDLFVVSPSIDIDTIAETHVHELPLSLRAFLRMTGSSRYNGGVNVASYLLFTRNYVEALIALGRQDALDNRAALERFLRLAKQPESLKISTETSR